MIVQPVGALIIGFLAGLLSTTGYAYIKPILASKINLHDTCGVNNLHGMPAIFAAIVSVIICYINDNSPFESESDGMTLEQHHHVIHVSLSTICTLNRV